MVNQNASRNNQLTTRRNLIRSGAAGVPLLLAGCNTNDPEGDGGDGGSNGGGDGGSNGGGDDGGTVTWKSFASYVPQDTQFNPYNPTNLIVQGALAHWAPLMQYHVGTDQWIPMIAEDWEIDGTTATLQITDEFSWHNGDTVTAEDVGTRLKLEYYMDAPLGDYLEGPPVVGDGAVELPLSNTVQGNIFWPQVTANDEYHLQQTPASIYGEYVERFEDASSDSARDEVQSDLLDFAPQEAGENVIGNGPFEFVEATESSQIFERVDSWPLEYVREQVSNTIDYDFSDWPDEIAIDRMEFENVSELWGAYRSGNLDGGADNAPPEVYQEYPDGYAPVGVPRDEGWGLTFQYDDDIFGRRNVRKALGHVVDTSPPLPSQMFSFGIEVDYHSGMSASMTEEWVSEDVRNSLVDYTGGAEAAASLLESEGFSQEDGDWYAPNGDRFQIVLKLPNYDDITAGMQVVEGMLNEFGIQTEFNAVELSTFTGDVEPNGDFEVVAEAWGNQPHPLYAYQANWIDMPAETNYPLTVEVPPIGEPDADPSMEVNINDLVTELAQTTDQSRIQEIVDTLAWTHNQDMPIVQCAEKAHHYLVSYDGWDLPEANREGAVDHDPLLNTHTPWHFPIHCGAIEPT